MYTKLAVFLCLSMGENMCSDVLAILSHVNTHIFNSESHVMRCRGEICMTDEKGDMKVRPNMYSSAVTVLWMSVYWGACVTRAVGSHVGLCIPTKVKLVTVKMTTRYDNQQEVHPWFLLLPNVLNLQHVMQLAWRCRLRRIVGITISMYHVSVHLKANQKENQFHN